MKARKILKDLREKKSLKQKDIAESISVSTSYYGMIEQGVRTPTLDIAKKIAELFDTTIEYLFFDDSNNNKLNDTQVSA